MKSSFTTLLVFGILGSVAACGGSISSDIAGGNGSGGSDSGTSESDGGTSTSDGGFPHPTPSLCSQTPTQLDLPATRMCIPAEVQFDDPLTLTLGVDETGYSCVTCTATVSDGTIRVELDGLPCADGAVCDNSNATVSCAVPALISGPYTVFFTHGDELDQVSLNAGTGGPTSCGLAPAQSIDPANYNTACNNDFDCTAVAAGDPCAGCECPDSAINTSSESQYQADWARQYAECPLSADTGPVGCGCPALGTPKCINNTCQMLAPANGG